jgi:oxygen-independent coproporphyrinogen-3 oxidase
MNPSDLLKKYDVPGPRYTSYPTVPYWDDTPTEDEWLASLKNEIIHTSTKGNGAALYLHIPFCEALCTFCACNKIITKKHERSKPYIDTLHKEWSLYKQKLDFDKLLVSEIHLGGGTPTFLTADELRYLLETLYRDIQFHDKAELSFEADPRVTGKDQMNALYDLGFRRISLGVQDYDPLVQTAINRVQSAEQISEVVDYARTKGYTGVNFDLVYGLPKQTRQNIEQTLQQVIKQRPDRIAFYSYAHVPWVGMTGQRGFTDADLPSGEEKRALYETGREILQRAGYHDIAMDHFALEHDALFRAQENKTLFRNFMGYIPLHVSPLIGLGCSSISDSWDCFIQNEKALPEWQKKIEQGQLPIARGHKLTAEDLVIRQHILNLMTRFETSWANDNTEHLQQLAQLLQEPINDNLIELDQQSIRVNEAGRPFIRNICTAFDARLQRHKPDTQIFSRTV